MKTTEELIVFFFWKMMMSQKNKTRSLSFDLTRCICCLNFFNYNSKAKKYLRTFTVRIKYAPHLSWFPDIFFRIKSYMQRFYFSWFISSQLSVKNRGFLFALKGFPRSK